MCLRRQVGLGRQHHAGRMREAREELRGFGQHVVHRLPGGGDLAFDLVAVVLGEVTDLHQRIDEKPQPGFGRQPARGSVRRIDQAELFEVLHDVAHRRRRQGHRDNARNIARADRLAGREITLDDVPEYLARALVELCKTDLGRADGNVLRHDSGNNPKNRITGARNGSLSAPSQDGRKRHPCRRWGRDLKAATYC